MSDLLSVILSNSDKYGFSSIWKLKRDVWEKVKS